MKNIIYLLLLLTVLTCVKDEPVNIEPEIEIIDCYFTTTISTYSTPDITYGIETFLINKRWIEGESNIILIDSCNVKYRIRIAVLEFEQLN